MEVGELQDDGHYPPNSFNHRVISRLEAFQDIIQEDSESEKGEGA
jgi:hypothetical protein